MKRAVLLTLSLLLGTVAWPTTTVIAAPIKGVKKVCPDGTRVPYKRSCPPAEPPSTPPTLNVADFSVSETGATATITVTKSTIYSVDSTVHYATSNGTATAGSDYTATSGTLTIPAASVSATFTIPILDDTTDETDETATITLSSPTNSVIGDGSAVLTIIDGDDPVTPPPPDPTDPPPPPPPVNPPVLSIVNGSIVESGGSLTVTVMKDKQSTTDSTYFYSTSNGTALAGSDYTFGSGTITVPGTALTSTFTIPIINDTTDELDETFKVTITAQTNSSIGVAQGTYTIIDNDDPPAPPSGLTGVASEGDSISQYWAGNHTGVYTTNNPTVHFCGLAQGGSVLGVPTDLNALTRVERIAAVDACRPKVFTVLIGANDLISWNPAWTADTWLARLYAYTDGMRNKGYKVLVGTILPVQVSNPNLPNYAADFNARRKVVNQDLREKVGTKIDGVIDFAADPVIGVDTAPNDPTLWQADKLHPTDSCGIGCGGQGKMYVIYNAAVNAALAGGTQTPEPPIVGDEPAESLEGYTWRLVTDHDYTKDLQPSWGNGAIPVEEPASDPVGAFRITCGDNVMKYDDPILYPGVPGRSHLHDLNGNMTLSANSTFNSLLQNGNSTCNFNPTGKSSQRSAYWIPALLDGHGNTIRPDYITVYYKRVPATHVDCGTPTGLASGPVGICTEIPNGLKMIAGSKMVLGSYGPANFRLDAPQVGFVCSSDGKTYKDLAALSAGSVGCTWVQSFANFPNCWDGKFLWKGDRTHVIYPRLMNDGKARCPVTNPYLITTLTILYNYTQIAPADLPTLKLASDYMNPNGPRGWSIHSDGWVVWDARVKRMFHDNCINKHLNCSGGDLGNGLQLIGAAQPRYNAEGDSDITAPFAPFKNPDPKDPEPPMSPNMVMP